ncbi:peroxiredoxin type-2 [Yamadazyma tenuis]|uniref:Redoxin domain-containing protein n=1 Tax=Candida tenuis (strain ATCC 10573 / BCRC 21748 / CBS 615 / JCM 9827 / NBRC 10315 / NRRL Y-1498 / VKM Y-70) TaxID=590646 RepID=G3BCM6_CANTC|nr:uncharacterized protein CANTEDRAFT_111868 [Yamadazyma tenuis ATCC 10573]EGV60202.1 hypothetical protein CANTEDRAFT_111868 [Yamadazyma tenuis ATCC 10573]WEJ94558.1 peroxiredoxin type-2 [Yamadazyma tenuis]
MQQGDKFPSGIEFLYIPVSKGEDALACSRPLKLSFDKLIADGNLLVVSVPAAFSPLCTEQHLPEILTNFDKLDALGIKNVVVYSVNDAFTLNAWGKLLVNKYNVERNVYFASDPNGQFTASHKLGSDKSKFGMGYRSERFAMVISKGVVAYLKKDDQGMENSGIKGIITAKL